jgi:hypothetical protein
MKKISSNGAIVLLKYRKENQHNTMSVFVLLGELD